MARVLQGLRRPDRADVRDRSVPTHGRRVRVAGARGRWRRSAVHDERRLSHARDLRGAAIDMLPGRSRWFERAAGGTAGHRTVPGGLHHVAVRAAPGTRMAWLHSAAELRLTPWTSNFHQSRKRSGPTS